MPPARRRAGNHTATPRSSQATLSFGSQSRVTKPSATPSQKAKDLDALAILPGKPSHDEISEPDASPATPSEPHVAEIAVTDQARTEFQQPLTEEEERALRITDRELRRYWNQEEAKRRAPRGASQVALWPAGPERLTFLSSFSVFSASRGALLAREDPTTLRPL